MTRLRTLIVDDEPLARERLRALLGQEDSVEIVGECGSGPEAIAAIGRDRPEIVFLDIQMPGCDGMQVVAGLPAKERPAIIFVTAHDRFAVEAFDIEAVDYLLKPFDPERLRSAVRRAAEEVAARRAGDLGARIEGLLSGAAAPAAPPRPERLAVKSDGRVVFLRPDEIVWIEASDNYVVIHLVDGGRLMLRETMASLEERLGATGFARVNRSAIVCLEQVKEMQPTFHGDYVVILRNGTRLSLSRALRGQLEKFASGSL